MLVTIVVTFVVGVRNVSVTRLTKFEFCQQIFKELHSIKFHEKPYGASRVVPFGRRDGRTHMTYVREAVDFVTLRAILKKGS
jgi:hypothetical protein